MTSDATVAPPTSTAARRYSEQIHALVDRQTREYLIGQARLEAEAGGYNTPREGAVIRDLIDDSIARIYRRDVDAYERAVQRGRQELAQRDRDREARIAETSRRVAAAKRPQA